MIQNSKKISVQVGLRPFIEIFLCSSSQRPFKPFPLYPIAGSNSIANNFVIISKRLSSKDCTHSQRTEDAAKQSVREMSRKRTTVWKRQYDPDGEFQSKHEREILRGISLAEASIKQRNVKGVQQVCEIVHEQIGEMNQVLKKADKQITKSRAVAESLPSVTDNQYDSLLSPSTYEDEEEGEHLLHFHPIEYGHGDNKDEDEFYFGASNYNHYNDDASRENSLEELNLMEKIWDLETRILEKEFEEAINQLNELKQTVKLKNKDIRNRIDILHGKIISEIKDYCTKGGFETTRNYAFLLRKLKCTDDSRNLILNSGETEILSELQYLTSNSERLTIKTINIIIERTLRIIIRTFYVSNRIDESTTSTASKNQSESDSSPSSLFVKWTVRQCDRVFLEFISPILDRLKKNNVRTSSVFSEIELFSRQHQRLLIRNKHSRMIEKSITTIMETTLLRHFGK